MRKQMLVAVMIAALPLAGLAQGGQGAMQGQGQGQGRAQGGPWQRDPERMMKRMKLARTLGLAEALDLEPAQALKLGDTLGKFDERRLAVHKQLREAGEVLRRAAHGEKVTAAEVDQAIQRALDARAQLQTLDRETVAAVTKDLTPEKKARAVLFLAKFQRRFGGHGPGMHGHGMERGMGPERGHPGPGFRGGRDGWGMGPDAGPGPGAMGMAQPNGWDDDTDE